MIGSIQQAVIPHDRYQVELKLDYELFEGKQTRYQIETYIFVPRTLAIEENGYSKANFYSDIRNHIRLKTPTLLLRYFCESPRSPLQTIQQIIQHPSWASNSHYTQPLIVQFKLLAATLKSAIREHIEHLRTELSATDSIANQRLLLDSLTTDFLAGTKEISQRYRDLFASFNLPNLDKQLSTGYAFTDESISILIEEGLIELWQIIQPYLTKTSSKEEIAELEKTFRQRILAETAYRQDREYPSILVADSDNEEYQYRASVLKKYASSVLFLSTDLQREGKRLDHIVQAVAAGIAMVFATATVFYFQQRYGNFTTPFFTALVIGYMFKDRIKEIGRSLMVRQLHNFLHDRRIAIYTQDRTKKLGVMREKVSFISESDLPRRIREARNYDMLGQVYNENLGEHIICYTKDILLYADTIREIFGSTVQITGINDIIRYDIRSLLSKMGDPVQQRYMFMGEHLQAVSAHKVYRVNLITKYASKTPYKDKLYKRHRLVINRSGIKRIEQVSV